jgi:hypothetical protein
LDRPARDGLQPGMRVPSCAGRIAAEFIA